MAVNKLSSSSKSGMVTRIITGIVLMAVLIPCTAFGNLPFFILMAFLSIVGIHEILKAPGHNRYNLATSIAVYAFVLSFIFWAFFKNYFQYGNYFSDSHFYMSNIFVSITGIILYALVLFLIAICSPKVTLNDVTYLFTIGIVFALGIQGMFFVRYFPNSCGILNFSPNSSIGVDTVINSVNGYSTTLGTYFQDWYTNFNLNQNFNSCLLFFFLLIGTWGSDVGAYFFGMLFGKHRMNPRISPHKTWEGFFGGMIVSAGSCLAYAAICEFSFNSPLIPGIIQFSHSEVLDTIGVFNGTAWPLLVIVSLAMPVVGNVGGFLYSLIKRQYGIKDYGKIFPGHGGVIDRFDSVMINAIILSIIVLLTANGWRFTV
ncbi:MAG: phosphatidate cytidylyltransferase [Bacilli bacterium]